MIFVIFLGQATPPKGVTCPHKFMARYLHLPIFQKAYDLNLEIYRTTHNFPREYKYSLGQKIKEISGELLDRIVAANAAENKGEHFPEIKARIERLRIQLRTAYDLKIITSHRLEFLNRLLEEISKQTAGWEKWFFENAKKSGLAKPEFLFHPPEAENKKRA